jgi:hypothetical protein
LANIRFDQHLKNRITGISGRFVHVDAKETPIPPPQISLIEAVTADFQRLLVFRVAITVQGNLKPVGQPAYPTGFTIN